MLAINNRVMGLSANLGVRGIVTLLLRSHSCTSPALGCDASTNLQNRPAEIRKEGTLAKMNYLSR